MEIVVLADQLLQLGLDVDDFLGGELEFNDGLLSLVRVGVVIKGWMDIPLALPSAP